MANSKKPKTEIDAAAETVGQLYGAGKTAFGFMKGMLDKKSQELNKLKKEVADLENKKQVNEQISELKKKKEQLQQGLQSESNGEEQEETEDNLSYA